VQTNIHRYIQTELLRIQYSCLLVQRQQQTCLVTPIHDNQSKASQKPLQRHKRHCLKTTSKRTVLELKWHEDQFKGVNKRRVTKVLRQSGLHYHSGYAEGKLSKASSCRVYHQVATSNRVQF